METKTIKTVIPEGYEIDKENSTFENIVLKPIEKKKWRDDKTALIEGYCINFDSKIFHTATKYNNTSDNYNIFAKEKQAKSALAMARISQIMANDKRFGGVITDEEMKTPGFVKYAIFRNFFKIEVGEVHWSYAFLSFHTPEQRDLFLKENEDLVKDYLMID